MIHFVSFYFLLVLSAYIAGFFNATVIVALLIPYFSVLYYFFRYMKTDNSYSFRPDILNSLLIALFVFEFDNIIIIYSWLKNFLPIIVRIEIVICLGVIIICIAGLFREIPVFSRNNLYISSISILIINVLIIYFGTKPVIDGYVHLKEAAGYFLTLQNPYSSIYSQVYSPEQVKMFYYDNPVFFKHVPFLSVPPVSIALYSIGHILGDVRIVNAILFCISPILLKSICSKIFPGFSGNTHDKMAIVLLLFPAQLYLIYGGWTDISIGFFIILFIYFFLKQQTVASYIALGILLSLKQYSVIYVIPFLFFMNLKDWKLYLVTGGIIIFPLAFYALWNPDGFIDGIVLYELKQPFRMDSISIPAMMTRYLDMKVFDGILMNILTMLLSFIVAVYFSIKKMPALDTGYKKIKFMLYVILFQFTNFLLFSKQAFLNQYYFLTVIFYLTMLFSIHHDLDGCTSPSQNDSDR